MPSLPVVTWRTFLVGNWVGAGITAGGALVTAGILSVVVGLLAKPADFGITNTMTLVTMIFASSFGGGIEAAWRDDFTGNGVYGAVVMPLTITLASMSVAAFVFRHATSRYPSVGPALADAARSAILVSLPVMVAGLIFRSDTDEFGRGWAAETLGSAGARVEFGVSVAGATVKAFLLTFVVLTLTCLARRDWWTSGGTRIIDRLAAPLRGLRTLVLLLPAAGLVGYLLLGAFGDDNTSALDSNADDVMAGVALLFSGLVTSGIWLLSVGSGAAFGYHSQYRDGADRGSAKEMPHLGTLTDTEPGLWAAPVVTLLVLFTCAYVVARRSRDPRAILPNLGVFVASVAVSFPLLLLLSGLRGSAHLSEKSVGTGYVGPAGLEATVYLTLLAALAAFVVALMSQALTLADIRKGLATAGSQLQTTPGSPAPSGSTPPSGPAGSADLPLPEGAPR
jgi:hypothetical protein